MKRKQQRDRKLAVERYSNGEHITSIAQSMGYSRKWVYKWIERHDSSDDAEVGEDDFGSVPAIGAFCERCGFIRLHAVNDDDLT